jgi:hypothetical protein
MVRQPIAASMGKILKLRLIHLELHLHLLLLTDLVLKHLDLVVGVHYLRTAAHN